MGKRKRQKVEERDPANESASKKQPSQTEEDGAMNFEEQPDRDPISKHNATMPKPELRDIFNNPGLRHISIKIFSYLNYKDFNRYKKYKSRYNRYYDDDDDSNSDSYDIWGSDYDRYGPDASFGDLQTCRLVCKAWRQVLETSRLYWIKRLFHENEDYVNGNVARVLGKTTYKEVFESAKTPNKWQWQDIKGLVLTLEKYLKENYEHRNLPERDWRNIDPLHYFVKTYRYYSIEDLEPIKIIIKFLTKLDVRNSVDRVSAFFRACESNDHEAVVTVFLRASRSGDKIINLNYKDRETVTGKTGFIRACELGNNSMVRVLINASKNGEINFNAKDKEGLTGLMWACQNGHDDVVETILENAKEKNIDVNAKCRRGYTALGWALYKNHKEHYMYEKFIECYGKVDIEFNTCARTNNTLWSVCQYCTECPGQILAFLLNHLEEFRIDVNETNESEQNVLHEACQSGNVEAVKTLLLYAEEKGIDVKKLDVDGDNILMAATGAYNAAPEVVSLLLSMIDELELNVNAVDNNGRSAFMKACEGQSLEIMQIFLLYAKSKKINLNQQDFEGNSGFILAAKEDIQNHGKMQILFENAKKFGIDVNLRNKNGETAFIAACIESDLYDLTNIESFVQNAIKAGIDLNIADDIGQTGFIKICAVRDVDYDEGQAKIIEYLLKHSESVGLDVNETDDNWMTGFMWACKLKRFRAVEKFIKHSEEKGGIDLDATNIHGLTGYDMWPKYFKKRHLFKFKG